MLETMNGGLVTDGRRRNLDRVRLVPEIGGGAPSLDMIVDLIGEIVKSDFDGDASDVAWSGSVRAEGFPILPPYQSAHRPTTAAPVVLT
jgi:hypothetical protein